MIGRRISHYRIVERLGEGGMGEVYRAEDTRLHRSVALKFLSARLEGRPRSQERFLREARTEAAVDHPNVCPVYDVGETEDGRTFIAMAYCEGTTLRELMDAGPMPVAECLRIGEQVAAGLAAAHARGIVHRDLKPRNVMISPGGEARIVDFGLAFLADLTRVTQSGAAVGTFAYMSPEQAEGEPVGPPSDVFSLGIVLYEMLAGRAPFSGGSDAAVLRSIVERDPEPLRTVCPDVPEGIAAVVERALAKRPEDRFPDAAAVHAELAGLRSGSGEAAVAGAGRREFATGRGRRGLRSVGLVTVAMAAVVAGIQLLGPSKPDNGTEWSPVSAGLAVLPEVRDGEPDEERIPRTGLADYLADALGPTWSRDGRWVVAPARRHEVGVERLADAAPVLGVGRVILVAGGQEAGWRVALVEFPGATEVASEPAKSAAAALAVAEQLLGVRSAEADEVPAAPVDVPESYLAGVGRLMESGEDPSAEAEAQLRAAIAEAPDFTPAHAALAEALRRRYESAGEESAADSALVACAAAWELVPSHSRARVTAARVLLRRGERDEAIALLRQAVAARPEDTTAHRWLGRALLRSDRRAEARQAFETATIASPGDPDGWEGWGAYLYWDGDYVLALEALERLRVLTPGYAKTYNKLGACYFALDCWQESTAMFEESFRLGHNRLACANLGTLYYMSGKFEGAVQMYDFALEYDPDDFDIRISRAAALFWIPGRKKDALAAYREALATPDAGDDAHGVQGEALVAGTRVLLGEPGALSDMDQLVARAPNDPEVLYRAVLAYEFTGRRERALVLLADLLELSVSRSALEHEPFLDELREDPRYSLIVKELPPTECRIPRKQGDES